MKATWHIRPRGGSPRDVDAETEERALDLYAARQGFLDFADLCACDKLSLANFSVTPFWHEAPR